MQQLHGAAQRLIQPRSFRLGLVAWAVVSMSLHMLVFARSCHAPDDLDDDRPFELPAEVEFGVAPVAPGGGNATEEPPPAPAPTRPVAKRHTLKAAPDPQAFALAARERAQYQANAEPAKVAAASAVVSGEGDAEAALGSGLGDGMGPGSGYAPAGATLALNVDLRRVRKTALVLETQALLDIIPEWQTLLAGSGIEPMKDLDRVFVASPTLQRASVVVATDHHLDRAAVATAVARLASEQGKPASLQARAGYEVAAWRSRGPTERSIALTGPRQFTITRTSDLARVLQVAQGLSAQRRDQGFAAEELEAHGGFLAMREQEAVALWVEGVHKYVRGAAQGVPASLRLSLFAIDQFNLALRVRAQYASPAEASEALAAMERLRVQLSEHPKVTFLGLKSAVDRAQIQPLGAALQLDVRLTLHQTRYLMRYVTRSLRPRPPRP